MYLTDTLPQTLLCSAGHAICYHCNEEAHAPCSCIDWKQWQNRVEKELRRAEAHAPKTGHSLGTGTKPDAAGAGAEEGESEGGDLKKPNHTKGEEIATG